MLLTTVRWQLVAFICLFVFYPSNQIFVQNFHEQKVVYNCIVNEDFLSNILNEIHKLNNPTLTYNALQTQFNHNLKCLSKLYNNINLSNLRLTLTLLLSLGEIVDK